MDYCSSCRRHLNGALVCPGCGAYAPDIDPSAGDGHAVAARAALPALPGVTGGGAATWEFTDPQTWHDSPAPHADETGTHAPSYTAPSGGREGAPQGRAARRRQMARWKKNQRRAVVATAVALVGGGLTVASMDRPSTDRAQAATVPEDSSMGGVEEQAPEYARPSAPRPDTHRSSPTPSAPPRANPLPRQQSVDAAPRTTPSRARTDVPAAPRAAQASTPQPRTTSPSTGDQAGQAPDRTDSTVTNTEPTPAPAATGGTGGTDQGTQQTSPAPAATSPSQLCLLVVCLG